MKRVVLLFLTLLMSFAVYSQCEPASREKQLKSLLEGFDRLIDNGLYHGAYQSIEKAIELVGDENEQINEIMKNLKKLKKKCPQKPKSECDCIKDKIDRGDRVSDEMLFFYDCMQLKEYRTKKEMERE
ncbi:MAG: hypothetical protein H6Q15_602 [Bacteroidetes bacterium]|nr:hypothetical protein [Bacteroidota bacterium]